MGRLRQVLVGRGRRRAACAVAVVALTGTVLFAGTPGGALPLDGTFELDSNAVAGAAPGEDWSMVCPASTPAGAETCTGGTTATAKSFVIDPDGATIFTGGGSKDDLDTTQWRSSAGSVPDKDELQHAFAARYANGNLYFGADRIANNGDSQIGFWFFQQTVGAQSDGTFGPGAHKDGDILILSDFTKGGGHPTVRVFQWNGPGGDIAGSGAIDGTLDLLAGTADTPQDCDTVASTDPFCATVNDAAEPSPWAFTPKNKPAGTFPPGEFYEGGVDLAFLHLDNECFSSFLAETRSSPSTDAVLKDFAGGAFGVCNASLTTTPSPGAGGSVTPGTSVTDTAVVAGSGVSSPPTPTGNVSFFLCGPMASGTCDSGGTPVGQPKALVDSSPPTGEATAVSDPVNTSGSPLTPGRYCFRAEWPGDSNYTTPLSHVGTGNSECFRVTDTTSVSTAQDWLPNDSATITAAGGSSLNGTLVFELHQSGDCSGSVLYTKSITITNQPSGTTFVTTNTTARTSSITVSWKTTFTSSDTNVGGSSGHCEVSSLTITN